MHPLFHASIAAALLFGSVPARAGDVRVTHARCAAEVHVVARDAPLSAVLKRLATVLDFQLRFDSDRDPVVTLDVMHRPEELPMRLGPAENVSVMLERDPRCAGQQRIVKVWVLPSGSARDPRPSVAAVRPSEEPTRQAKEGAEMILRAHGIDALPQ
jgi:hypothetical protein